jgi:hypothetical protein
MRIVLARHLDAQLASQVGPEEDLVRRYLPVDALLVNPFFVRGDGVLLQLRQNVLCTLRKPKSALSPRTASQATYLDGIRIDIDCPVLHAAVNAEIAQEQRRLQQPQLRLAVNLPVQL